MPRIGFLGLGTMGEPMATNLQRAGVQLAVWNRSAPAAEHLAELGAVVHATPTSALACSDVVLMMLADAAVTDAVLGRDGPEFAANVRDRVVVNMATTAPAYSEGLGRAVVAGGGRYVEAPVSGSRVPAERGELVAMLGGLPCDLDLVEPLLTPMCHSTLRCGDVPSGMTSKLAVNVFLITMVAGLVEAFHFARRHGLDLEVFRTAINAGQMASAIGAVKLDKLISNDLSAQAAISNVYENTQLITAAARASATAAPLMDVCDALFRETRDAGLGREDMAAVVRALELRTEQQGRR